MALEQSIEYDIPMTAASNEAMREVVANLPDTHKDTFERIFFAEEEREKVTTLLDCTVKEVDRIYGEAVDMIVNELGIN